MSSYQEFIKEKQLIDELLKNNFEITAIEGTLDGDRVELEKQDYFERQSIILTNSDSRKYVTTLLIKGQLYQQ
ncbi:hypothetical protein [Oceanobacillus salinisoli]|uniref:hypothetical protein n=1 Tax=Oceanobacillus salinisoli TaxID=2678611 RepID=UPI0012E0E67D|nr:hypothetical protein [Oceanobacillus salinisoli]